MKEFPRPFEWWILAVVAIGALLGIAVNVKWIREAQERAHPETKETSK